MDDRAAHPGQVPAYADIDTVIESPVYPIEPTTQSRSPRRDVQDPNTHATPPPATLTPTAPPPPPPLSSHGNDIVKEKPSAQVETRHDYKLVTFTENDPKNPKNWSKGYKWYCTMVVAVTCFVVAFASSVITADVDSVAREFNVSHEAALVSISVFVVGFGVGMYPLPISSLGMIFEMLIEMNQGP